MQGLAALAQGVRCSFAKIIQGLVKPPKRMLPDYLAYQRLYYETKLKAIVDEDYERIMDDPSIVNKPKAVAHRNALVQQLLKNESKEVKDEVEKYRNAAPQTDYDIYVLDDENDLDEKEKARCVEARKAQA